MEKSVSTGILWKSPECRLPRLPPGSQENSR
jgi:hypothetical protein